MMFWVTSCADNKSNGGSGQGTGFTQEGGSGGNGDSDEESDSDDLEGDDLDDLEEDEIMVLRKVGKVKNKYYYHPNHNQTATLVTNDKGEVHARIRHLPYGEVDLEYIEGRKDDKQPIASFTGQEKDDSTGLIYFNARYYDPSLGRFISPDTIIDGDGTNFADFNRYAYVKNNPINFTDPTGRELYKRQYGGTYYALTIIEMLTARADSYNMSMAGGNKCVQVGICHYLWSDYQRDINGGAADLAAAAAATANAARELAVLEAAAAETAAAEEAAAEAARLVELERIRLAFIRQGKIDLANAFKSSFTAAVQEDMNMQDYADGFAITFDYMKKLDEIRAPKRRRGGLIGVVGNIATGVHGLMDFAINEFRAMGDHLSKDPTIWMGIGAAFTGYCTGATWSLGGPGCAAAGGAITEMGVSWFVKEERSNEDLFTAAKTGVATGYINNYLGNSTWGKAVKDFFGLTFI